jgi:hypothetical protein
MNARVQKDHAYGMAIDSRYVSRGFDRSDELNKSQIDCDSSFLFRNVVSPEAVSV